MNRMADDYVKFKNDLGLAEIGIGVTEFECIGATRRTIIPTSITR
jgi:hypothetical protein